MFIIKLLLIILVLLAIAYLTLIKWKVLVIFNSVKDQTLSDLMACSNPLPIPSSCSLKNHYNPNIISICVYYWTSPSPPLGPNNMNHNMNPITPSISTHQHKPRLTIYISHFKSSYILYSLVRLILKFKNLHLLEPYEQ